MTLKLLHESSAVPLAPLAEGYKAVLITPGQGTSGKYSESMLREHAATAFPPGTHAYVDHPTEQNPGRSPEKLIGVYPEGATYEEGVGVVAKFVPMPHWAAFVEAVAPYTGLSIYAMGESDASGNVTSLVADTQNSVDLVSYPGRSGSGLKMYESAIAAGLAERTETPSDEGKKETKMTPEQEAKLDKLALAFESFVTESKEAADKRAQESVDAKAAKTAEDARVEATIVALEAVNKADLPDALRENLVSVVKAGNTDVDKMIENAVKLHESVKAEVEAKQPAPTGFFSESSSSASDEAKEFEALFGGGK